MSTSEASARHLVLVSTAGLVATAAALVLSACRERGPDDVAAPTSDPDAVEVDVGPEVVCADPGLRDAAPLTEVAGHTIDPAPTLLFDGGAIAVADLDGDGLPSIVAFRRSGPEHYEVWPGGDLVPVPASDWLIGEIDLTLAYGVAAADDDGDGDVDLFVSRYLRFDVLLRNDGTGRFTDAAPTLGLAGPLSLHSSSPVWGDVDGDTDLDLFVGGHLEAETRLGAIQRYPPGDPDFLFRNEGDGTFTDVSAELPPEIHDSYAMAATFVDLDGDDRQDLYVANDFGAVRQPSMVAWNRPEGWAADDGSSGLLLESNAMGIGVGDVNADGSWDLMVPAWGGTALLMSDAELGVWFDHTSASGLKPMPDQVTGWGAEIEDLDNDGDLDLAVAFGFLTAFAPNPTAQSNAIFLQGADGQFTQVSAEWGLAAETNARTVLATDVDDDGWLDIVTVDLGEATLLYRASCGAAHWLKVRLAWPGTGNPWAEGATIRVEAGGHEQRRPMRANGRSYASSALPEAHFGLGAVDTVERVVVRWPDGVETAVEDVPTDRTITVRRLR